VSVCSLMMNLRRVGKALAVIVALLVAAAIGLFVYAQIALSSDYLLLPDTPHKLAPLVKVQGGRPNGKGGIYFVDVIEKQATLAERYLPFLRDDGASLVPKQDVVPGNVSVHVQNLLDQEAMTRSKEAAEVVALDSLGYKVRVQPEGALVDELYAGLPAATKLVPGDVITAVDGKKALTAARAQALITAVPVGRVVRLTIDRAGRILTVSLRTVTSPFHPGRAGIGVAISPAVKVKLPIKVAIDPGNVGGPSAGLAFALELSQKLGRNVDHGYRIAATGEIGLDGSVTSIGGVEQKVIGARRSGIQVMLVPAGDNTRTARRYAGAMKIIPVTSFQQALHDLATLAPNR
jgi:PDZ domain-containing protein